MGARFVNLRAASNVSYFSFYEHGRVDRFENFYSLLGLAHVFFKGQGRQIKDNRVESSLCCFHPLRERVRMIRVKKNGEVEFLAHTSHESCNLTSAKNLPLAFRQADQNWRVQFPGSRKNRFQ